MSNTSKIPIKVALFNMSGDGDMWVFLAPVEALYWCLNATPGKITAPPEVQRALIPFLRSVDPVNPCDKVDTNEQVNVSRMGLENDVALFLFEICRTFDTQRQALAYAAKQGWDVIENEYYGSSY